MCGEQDSGFLDQQMMGTRRFFRDPDMTSKIIGVDKVLIRRFRIILQILACRKKNKYC